MVQIGIDEFIELAKQGVKGNAAGFCLLCRRIVSHLKKNNPEEATRLAEVLAGELGIRGNGAMTLPVDADTRRYLLQENRAVVLQREPVWSGIIASVLNQVLNERRESVRLIQAGLEPVRAVL
ncbi:MAG: AAA family ATPase, partial [Betaproteobacteria bacterium]|nr:AAA family ATPase [Betaproteobacteria bacterium]